MAAPDAQTFSNQFNTLYALSSRKALGDDEVSYEQIAAAGDALHAGATARSGERNNAYVT